MKIQILGTGCAKCRALGERVEQAVREAGVAAEIEKVTELDRIAEAGVMMTPALALDGRILAEGRVPSVEQIKAWL